MKDIVLVALALAVVVAVALSGVYGYSRQQLTALRDQPTYATPEEGMRDLVADAYLGLKKVEIVHAGYEPCFQGNLYFVEARVWADGRVDGKEIR